MTSRFLRTKTRIRSM